MQNCVRRANQSYTITSVRLGRGIAGEVFAMCKKTDCDSWVAKVVQFNLGGRWNQTPEMFTKEVQISKEIGSIGFGPKILDSIICRDMNIGIMLMERLDITLHHYIRQSVDRYTRELMEKIVGLIYEFVNAGFYNEDLHTENIMLKLRNNQIVDIKFIDAGYTRHVRPDEDKFELAMKMVGSLKWSMQKVTLVDLDISKHHAPSRKTKALTPVKKVLTPTQLDTPSPPRRVKRAVVKRAVVKRAVGKRRRVTQPARAKRRGMIRPYITH